MKKKLIIFVIVAFIVGIGVGFLVSYGLSQNDQMTGTAYRTQITAGEYTDDDYDWILLFVTDNGWYRQFRYGTYSEAAEAAKTSLQTKKDPNGNGGSSLGKNMGIIRISKDLSEYTDGDLIWSGKIQ